VASQSEEEELKVQITKKDEKATNLELTDAGAENGASIDATELPR
jgi:hypothetical protein